MGTSSHTHFAMQAKAILVASAAAVLVIIGMVAFMAPSSQSVSPLGHTSVTPATKMFSIFNIGGSTCTTVSSLDIDQFAGNWYQVINNGYTEIFGGGTSCTGTVYTKTSDTAIAVENGDTYNCNTTDATTGTCTEFTSLINGTAEVTDSSEPGQLTLTLYTPFLFGLSLPTTGSYWICKLGPVVNGKYAYAIVSDSDGVSLYVLARNVESFYSTYYDEVYDYINSDLSWMVGGPTGTLEPIDNTFGTCPGDGDDSFY